MKINHPDWYPSYVNPTFEEILELAHSSWDTCRILVPYCQERDGEDIVIASGYGNTHDSIQSRYFVHLGMTEIEVSYNGIPRRRWRTNGVRMPSMWSCILYHENGVALMNNEDSGGTQRDRYDRWHLADNHLEILKDLVRESGLSL